MEFTSIKELYQKLIPAFNVKRRLNKNLNYTNISNKDMWIYLANNRWKNSVDLTIAEMVNDIINLDVSLLRKEEKYEKY